MTPLSPREGKLNTKRWWHKEQPESRRKKWRLSINKGHCKLKNPLLPWNNSREPTVFFLRLSNKLTNKLMMSRIWTQNCSSAKSLQYVINSLKKIKNWNVNTWKSRRNLILWWKFRDWSKLRRKVSGIKNDLMLDKKLGRSLLIRLMKNTCKDKRSKNWEKKKWFSWRGLRNKWSEMRRIRSKKNKRKPKLCLWKLRRPTSNRCCSRKRSKWRISKMMKESHSTIKKRLTRITKDKLRPLDWSKIEKGIWPSWERLRRRSPINKEILKVTDWRGLSNKVKETPGWESNSKLIKSNVSWKTWIKLGRCNSKSRKPLWLSKLKKKERNS